MKRHDVFVIEKCAIEYQLVYNRLARERDIVDNQVENKKLSFSNLFQNSYETYKFQCESPKVKLIVFMRIVEENDNCGNNRALWSATRTRSRSRR